jgi:hypothetical protein
MLSLAEQGQDIFAFEQIQKLNGTFLDVGCWDPTRNNNTYALEQLGWRGLLIDIDSHWSSEVVRHRKSPFIEADATKIEWQALCMDHQLGAHIDYLSLDVDDKDEEPISKTLTVLKNIIGYGITFQAITVEHDAYRLGNEPRTSIRQFLLANGYRLFRENISCRPPDPNWAFEDWFVGVR